MNINLNRREFVAKSVWGATASLSLPGFLQQTLLNLDARAQTLPPQGDEGPIILLMEMAGGNDALNTVIPYTNSTYIGARETLHLREQDGIIKLTEKGPSVTGTDEDIALHPTLTAFHQLWQDGDLGIVNGVGYPNPNLSHFTSFDYWHSAEPNSVPRDGWIGRYLDNQCDGCGATTGIYINRRPTLAFKSDQGISPTVTFNNAVNFDWRDLTGLGREKSLAEMYRRLIGLDHETDNGINESDPTLSYVQRAAHSAMISTASVQAAIDEAGDLLNPDWPTTGALSNSLQTIARLIKGRSQTSVYYARQGGYDTHNNQIFDNASPLEGRHFNLLQDLNNSLGAFVDEMKLQGQWDRVLILTFSEFGRKVIQNGSRGTDHGAAESLFVMGGQVKGNEYYGLMPDLAAQARVSRNSMDYNVDFRTVYRTVLEKWMGVPPSAMPNIFPSQPVNFDPLAFL
jgi:uncharacterized protein (DUF1501 family)